MFKSIWFRTLTIVAIFSVSTVFTYTYAQELGKKSEDIPSIHDAKTFLIYAKKGNLKVFNRSGKIVKNEEAKDFRDGELLFIITDPKRAILSANTGVSNVEFVKNTDSVTFIETTSTGNKRLMIIENKWDVQEGGFKFTYTRMTQNDHPIANSRSVYTGIAKPTLLYKHSRKPNQVVPSLQIQKHFTIFKLKGNFKTFNLETGKLLQNEDASIRDGDMMFMITGPKNATMFGNAGSAEVELVKDDNFLMFVETTLLGGMHIMIIANEWDAKEKGFKFTYIRNIEERIFASEFMRTIANGVAKPAGY
jgi:hypothetical protein